MDSVLMGIFDNERDAIDFIRAEEAKGIPPERFSIIAKDQSKKDLIHEVTDAKEVHPVNEEAYGIISGFLMGISGGFVVPGLTVPEIGPLLAAGPLASAIPGDSHQEAADLFISLGIDPKDTDQFVRYLNDGKILVFADR